MSNKEQLDYNFTAIDNAIKGVFLSGDNELDYGDLAVYVYIAMFIQVGENGPDGKCNGKQGYCHKTKAAIQSELRISKGKLNRHIANLKRYGFIDSRTKPNKYGGRDIEEYRLVDDWKTFI